MRISLENWSALSEDAPRDDGANHSLSSTWAPASTCASKCEKIAAAFEFKGLIRWDNSKPDGTPKSNRMAGRSGNA